MLDQYLKDVKKIFEELENKIHYAGYINTDFSPPFNPVYQDVGWENWFFTIDHNGEYFYCGNIEKTPEELGLEVLEFETKSQCDRNSWQRYKIIAKDLTNEDRENLKILERYMEVSECGGLYEEIIL